MIPRVLRSRVLTQAVNLTRSTQSVRCLSTFEKHRSVFDALGLERTGNKGVFDGEWKGSGEIIPSYNPVNNEVIAEVITGTTGDLDVAFEKVAEAQKIWRELPVPKRGH
ncbi:hypothetical protein CU098_000607, partial [Rhizopus stolonifer]